jgi:crossover junction endodeoxyribonuclease RusA
MSDDNRLRLEVAGIPVPQGSKRVVAGRLIDANQGALRPWRASVTAACAQSMSIARIAAPIDGPVSVHVAFRMPRPKSHYGTGRNAGQLKDTAPVLSASRPDLDKKEYGLPAAGITVGWG